VVVSVGWLGLDLGLLALGVTGLATDDPATLRAAYLAMGVFAGALLVPVALLTVVSGVVVSVFTPWGLVRYRWVLVKFGLTVVAATATIFLLRPTIAQAVADVSALPAGAMRDADLTRVGRSLVAAPCVAFTIYLVCTVLSVYKPWGRTRWGARSDRRRTSRPDRSRPGRPVSGPPVTGPAGQRAPGQPVSR
ncbi:MAG TPA: hypothetical protein VFX70_05215, partial [Mycobacteriales bacterium]|nr:hypothetical protein [Mycobacteriales bacterium]